MWTSGRSQLRNPDSTIEQTEIAVEKLFEEIHCGSTNNDVYLDAVKDTDGNCFWERKIVRSDGTELLYIKTQLKDFQNKPMSGDSIYEVVDTRVDAKKSPADVSNITSESAVGSSPTKKENENVRIKS